MFLIQTRFYTQASCDVCVTRISEPETCPLTAIATRTTLQHNVLRSQRRHQRARNLPTHRHCHPHYTPTQRAALATQASGDLRVTRIGFAGSATLGDALVVSVWRVGGVTGGGGMRLATVPTAGGTVVAATVTKPCTVKATGASTRWIHSPVAYELSASVPVADGIMMTPGLVLARHEGRATAALALQSTWRF
eukprot:356111-Chlamydomonas_euryale.AAC.1